MVNDPKSTILDITFLYELSLSIGKSFDLRENCMNFLQLLVERRNLSYAAIWLRHEALPGIPDSNQLSQVLAYPADVADEELITADHPMVQPLSQEESYTLTHHEEGYQKLSQGNADQKGAYAVFRLNKLGVLKVYVNNLQFSFSSRELNQLSSIISKFSMSIEACLNYEGSIIDYKKRLEVESSLNEKNLLYKAVVEGLQEGLLITNAQEKIIFVNKRLCELTGYSLEELQHQQASSFFISEEEEPTASAEEPCLFTTRGKSTLLFRHKNGSKWWAQINCESYYNSQGKAMGYISVLNDVTEIKTAQERQNRLLDELESRNRDLLEQKVQLTIINRFSRELIEVTSVQQAMTGVVYNLSQNFSSCRISLFLKSEDKGVLSERAVYEQQKVFHYSNQQGASDIPHMKLLHRLLETNESHYFYDLKANAPPLHLPYKSGSLLLLPVFTEEQVVGILEVYHTRKEYFTKNHIHTLETLCTLAAIKISNIYRYEEQKKVKSALKDSKQLTQLTIESAMDAVVVMDENWKIINWNKAAEQIYGYTKEEIIGQSASVLVPDIVQPRLEKSRKEVQTILKGEGALGKRHETLGLRKNGEVFPLEVSTTPSYTSNGIIYNAFIREITDRVQAEQELLEAKHKAEESAKAKEAFLANMSHEIRTPMNAIIGMSRLLEGDNLTEKQRKFIRSIIASSDNLLVVINDILDISKIEAGKLDLEYINFNLQELIENIWLNLKITNSKQITLIHNIDERISPVLVGDPVRISQVLLNLLGNAVKFTEKGEVRLDCELAEHKNSQDHLLFRVSDTGIGIEESKLQYIFDSFRQEDNTTSRKFGGTGLGLAICKQLVQLMDGSIEVESQKGKGTTFTVELCLQTAREADASADKQLDNCRDLSGLRVLLAEDNQFNQVYAVSVLEEANVEVSLVETGREAIEQLKAKEFDVILMDVHMPEMDGLQATEYIRQELHIQTPIIALTADALKGDAQSFLQVGMNDYISKPFYAGLLRNRVEQWGFGQDTTEQPRQNRFTIGLDNLEIIAHGDSSLFCELLEVYEKNSKEVLVQIDQYIQQQNYRRLYRSLEKLKEASSLIEIPPLSQVIANFEEVLMSTHEAERLSELNTQLKKIYEQVFWQLTYIKKEKSSADS